MLRLTMRKDDGTVFKQENPWLEAALEKLARYEDAEDEGRLIVLPKKPERLDLSRTAELILADEEGRVVILAAPAERKEGERE